MVIRFAFFVGKDSVEQFFECTTPKDFLFTNHYNLAPGHSLPVIKRENEDIVLTQIPLGPGENQQGSAELFVDDVAEKIQKNKVFEPVILPLSGFYIWKGDHEDGQPFFVRMLNSSIMPVAGVLNKQQDPYIQVITVPGNTLIQPISDKMPLFLNKESSKAWLNTPQEPALFLQERKNIFAITDLSVLKVSKRVNDLTENDPTLIQPEPK